jgi:serine/threonine protein kinase
MVGTKWYKAPEVLFGSKNYDKSVDIWSFGCIMAELFLLEPIFPGGTDFEMINYIFDFLGYTKEDNDVFFYLLRFFYPNLSSISKNRSKISLN